MKWGEQDPYFAVITNPKFRASAMDEKAKAEFFASGENHVRYVLGTCRKLAPAFAPQSVLDFGCGVGRVLLPLAQVEGVARAVGVDISPAMLEEARRNQTAQGVTHARFLPSDLTLSQLNEPFDFVHSFIVFQHIDVPRGRQLFRRLVDLINPGGMGALHVLTGKAYHAERFGQPPAISQLPNLVQPVVPSGVRKPLLRFHRWWRQRSAAQPAADPSQPAPAAQPPGGDPEMQMNPYNLSELLFVLQSAGVKRLHIETTDHGGELGAFLFFQKPAA